MDKATVPITVTKFIEAPAQRIYDAWLIPSNASKWLFATPTGEMVRVEIEPRVGGKFVFTDRRDGQDVEHIGEFLELEPGRKLAFKFKVPKYSDEFSTVRMAIFPPGRLARDAREARE